MKFILNTIVALLLSVGAAGAPMAAMTAAGSAATAGRAVADDSAAADGVRSEAVQKLVESLAEGGVLGSGVFGMMAVTSEGERVAAYNPDKAMVPASNMKLITTGAALHDLGPSWQFSTKIGYVGEIRSGVLYGDLYIVGGGDPTLGSRDSVATRIETTFRQWREILSKAGINRIEGHIVGDDRFFEPTMEEDTWLWNDIGTYYGTGVSGLSFYENAQDFSVAPGSAVGAPVKVTPGYPQTPWMEFRYSCTTGEAQTGNQLYYFTSPFAPVGQMRGTFAIDRAPKTERGSNKYPAYTCAAYFAKYLRNCGVACSLGPADLGDSRRGWLREEIGFGESAAAGKVAASKDIRIIGETLSPQLQRIAFETNYESNNFFAETLFKTLGKENYGTGSYNSGRWAVRRVLTDLGVNSSKVKIQDGSGLSRQNYVTPEFFCEFMGAMLDSPAASYFIKTLPSPGSNGTMVNMMRKYDPSVKSRIFLKSGSMNGVMCYTGYILPPSGTGTGAGVDVNDSGDIIIFSVMTNNCTSPTAEVRAAIEKIIAALAAVNQ